MGLKQVDLNVKSGQTGDKILLSTNEMFSSYDILLKRALEAYHSCQDKGFKGWFKEKKYINFYSGPIVREGESSTPAIEVTTTTTTAPAEDENDAGPSVTFHSKSSSAGTHVLQGLFRLDVMNYISHSGMWQRMTL